VLDWQDGATMLVKYPDRGLHLITFAQARSDNSASVPAAMPALSSRANQLLNQLVIFCRAEMPRSIQQSRLRRQRPPGGWLARRRTCSNSSTHWSRELCAEDNPDAKYSRAFVSGSKFLRHRGIHFAPQPGKLRRERKAADRPARGATRSWLGRVVFAHFAS
jgi:hypothetical protein